MKTYVGPGNCTRTFTQCSFKKNKNNKQTNKTPQKKKKNGKNFVYFNNYSIAYGFP